MTEPPDISPDDPNFERLVEQRLEQYAAEYSIEKYPSEHRNHLGASSIGEECWRKLWFQFRWVKLSHAEPRMRRLWARGHREEEAFADFLRWAGFSSRSIDEATGKELRFSKINGHYGGTTDGKKLIRWANNVPLVVDYKTFADKYFQELKKKRVRAAQPKYYAQLCSYGREFECEYGLLFGLNKDNDEWYFEFVKLDWRYAEELEKKASEIIHAIFPPNRISEQPAFYKCKQCHFSDICHNRERVEINCRSCANALPIENGNWSCKIYGTIPKDFISQGCQQHQGIV